MIHPYLYTGLPARERVIIMQSTNGAVYTINNIVQSALRVFNNHNSRSYTIDDLKSPWRKREVVECRQVCMYIMKQRGNYKLKRIGKHFGGRDHSTVIHACNTVTNLLDTDKTFKSLVDKVMTEIHTMSIKDAEIEIVS